MLESLMVGSSSSLSVGSSSTTGIHLGVALVGDEGVKDTSVGAGDVVGRSRLDIGSPRWTSSSSGGISVDILARGWV